MQCGAAFGLLRRRHHCRCCGWLVCSRSLSHRLSLDRWVSSTKGHKISWQQDEHGRAHRGDSPPSGTWARLPVLKVKKVCRMCASRAPWEISDRTSAPEDATRVRRLLQRQVLHWAPLARLQSLKERWDMKAKRALV